MTEFRSVFVSALRNSNLSAFEKSRLRLRSLSPVFQREIACVVCEHVVEAEYILRNSMNITDVIVDQCNAFLNANDVSIYVDWDRLLEFIEKLLPIILKLIDLFS